MAVSKPTPEGGEVVSERKTVTNWSVFDKAGLVPTRITCNGYLGQHPSDLSCHSNLIPTSASVLKHMAPEHGGGWFFFRMRTSDTKGKNPIWRELQDAGVEIQHLYCPHCRQEIQLTPRGIISHLQPHPGANRVNVHPQTVCMTLGYNDPHAVREDLMEEEYE